MQLKHSKLRILGFALGLLLCSRFALGQTLVSPSCNLSDIVATMNSVTQNGTTVEIPACPAGVTWSTPETVTLTYSTYLIGAGTGSTVITDNYNPSGVLTVNIPSSLVGHGLAFRLSGLTFQPGPAISSMPSALTLSGTCTSSGCPEVRIDHLSLPTSWQVASGSDGLINVMNLFGVGDHNTSGAVSLFDPGMGSYLGIGTNGDNSWASADGFGSANAFFIEDNTFTGSHARPADCVPFGVVSGGCRIVVRFNTIIDGTGLTAHGTESSGRMRSVRTGEFYGNSVSCSSSSDTCYNGFNSYRGGDLLGWGNTYTASGTGQYSFIYGLTMLRANNLFEFGQCVGVGAWDENDGSTVEFTGTLSSGGTTTLTDSSASWTANAYAPGTNGLYYYVFDTTTGAEAGIASNSASQLTLSWVNSQSLGNSTTFSSGDGIEIVGVTEYASFTNSGATGTASVTDSSASWSTNQWSPLGAAYSVLDVNTGLGNEITSNTSTTLSLLYNDFTSGPTFNNGDTIVILRASACLDQPSRGPGSLFTRNSQYVPTTIGWPGEPLDPSYFFDDSYGSSLIHDVVSTDDPGHLIPNRDWYTQGTMGAQVSPTSPFNGTFATAAISSWSCSSFSCEVTVPSTSSFTTGELVNIFGTTNSGGSNVDGSWTITGLTPTQISFTGPVNTASVSPSTGVAYTNAVGSGTLANRPTSCMTGVAYWATDQGNWNQSGNGFGQGELFKCTATNTWTLYYTPYVYPHPLDTNASSSGSGSGISGSGTSTMTYVASTVSNECVGFAPYFCARKDLATVQETPMALPAVNTPFIDPDFGERMVRVTNDATLQQDPNFSGDYTVWFTASASRYPEWGVFCPASGSVNGVPCALPGVYRLEGSVDDLSGDAQLFTFNPTTMTTAMGIGAPGSSYVPVPLVGANHHLPNTTDRWLFSLVNPDLMYTSGSFSTPKWVASSQFHPGVAVQPTTANGHEYVAGCVVSGSWTDSLTSCTSALFSGATQPTWCTTSGCQVTDTAGSSPVVWKENGGPVSSASAATIVGWWVTDPVEFLVQDLSNCTDQANYFTGSDTFDGPYPVEGDTLFNVYGGHFTDTNGAADYNQNAWNALIVYNKTANTCSFLDTQDGVEGTYNFGTSTLSTNPSVTDPITGAAAGVIPAPSGSSWTATASTTGGSLAAGTYWLKPVYEWADGSHYFPSSPGASVSVSVSSGTTGSISGQLPLTNHLGQNGASCQNASTANCFYDQPTAEYAQIAACGPSTTECAETLQGTPTAIPVNWWPLSYFGGNGQPAIVVPNVPNGHEYKATTAGKGGSTEPAWCTTSGCTVTDGTITWTENGPPPSYTLTSISAGSSLPSRNMSGFGIHSAVLDMCGQVDIMTSSGSPYSLNLDWVPFSTSAFPFPNTNGYYSGPITTWPWRYWGGHSYVGCNFGVGDNGNTNFTLVKRTGNATNPSVLATAAIYPWQTDPACTGPGSPCTTSQDYHPATGAGENGTTYPFYVDSYQSEYGDAYGRYMTIGGPWQREETARDPESGTVYRFAHRRTASLDCSLFLSADCFWSTSVQEPSQDGKYVLFSTDWDGSIGGTSCSGYIAGQVYCGLHFTGSAYDGTSCALTSANRSSCMVEMDLVIVELK